MLKLRSRLGEPERERRDPLDSREPLREKLRELRLPERLLPDRIASRP